MLVIPGRAQRESQMCNCTSGNLEDAITSGFRIGSLREPSGMMSKC